MGAAADGVRALDPPPEARSRATRLARPRSLRPVRRPRLDAALRAAPPDRLRPPARRPPALPPVGQPHARPPGVALTPGVEATTGPLGQGLANAVGMAIAEAHLAARFNRPGHRIVDHHTYVLASDGDLMEGVTAEAASLAGHLAARQADRPLRRQPHLARRHDRPDVHRGRRPPASRAYGWHVARRSRTATTSTPSTGAHRRGPRRRPTGRRSSSCAPRIGYGAPHKQDTFEAHGSPLGPDELTAAKEHLGWPLEPTFWIPPEALAALPHRRRARARAGTRRGNAALDALRARAPRPRGRAPASHRAASCRPAGTPSCPSFPADAEGARHAQGRRDGAADARRAPAGADRRLGRSESVDAHLDQGRAATSSRPDSRHDDAQGARRRAVGLRGPQPPLRRARARDGRGRERHGAPRRLHPVRLDVPRLLRLHAPAHPPLRADGARQHLGLHARQHRRRRGRARPTSRSSTTRRCARSRACSSSARATPTRPSRPGASRSRNRHRPTVPRAHAPERPDARPHALRPGGAARAAAPTCSIPTSARPDVILMATGSEVQLDRRAAEALLRQRGHRARGSSPCPAGSSSTSSPPSIATPCCRPT